MNEDRPTNPDDITIRTSKPRPPGGKPVKKVKRRKQRPLDPAARQVVFDKVSEEAEKFQAPLRSACRCEQCGDVRSDGFFSPVCFQCGHVRSTKLFSTLVVITLTVCIVTQAFGVVYWKFVGKPMAVAEFKTTVGNVADSFIPNQDEDEKAKARSFVEEELERLKKRNEETIKTMRGS